MEKIRNTVRVFVIKNDKVVCTKYKQNNIDFYDIPGGKIEPGETEVQACIREFKEETGMNISNLIKIGVVIIVYPNKIYIMNTYVTNDIEGEPQEFEENYSYWKPITELLSESKRFAITHLLDDNMRDYLNSNNINIEYTCDEHHNIINSKIN